MPYKYRYACVNRPAGYASVPTGYIKVEDRPTTDSPYYDLARNGFVVYDRPLTSEEMKSYELAKIFTDSDEKALIDEMLSDDLLEYADSYIKIAEEDFEEFKYMLESQFDNAVKKLGYYMHGVADINAFLNDVLGQMKESAVNK